MKFSNDTLTILKNFSQINQSIMFKPGNKVRTIHPQRTVLAEAKITEDITQQAGVYDLSRFIGVLSMASDPEIDFGSDRFTISSSNGGETSYTYTAENMIVTPPDKEIKIPNVEATVFVSSRVLDEVTKAANILNLPEISFKAENGVIWVSATDSKTPTSDSHKVKIQEGVDCQDFELIVQRDNLRLLPGDYDVSLSTSGMAHFKSDKVQYWIAVTSN